ncbi:MAG: hypothetical protein A3G49_06425 [Candidatus Sungbacteria bacterium RIFCSPLOWO2_12_FULL_41_11]|uniref:Uncharacterized protein n=1 Tax=Candidatus Sungbacteria bacterium RIFCSPLOWO2_12_FULL_41_11 TaxID=1802286 RepID=A0A1G2LS56_9BACT|nr:MAG: hypothetical protein UV01_C0003G0063 [Parcubacteria group bacterium GW2011_GWA2_42_14]OGZ99486.1 MAG: hypothetical protein A3D41_05875 [Candidatus Sungbacteria bacterium RIFCSPHIGHO2_02_FULL_41_12b]OHA14456.1 MAG: hypothetical protein A3G49_06425 [Candidatus Sungbacteria bacterium RIFCSPLOWO2_12_FULL_41_11]
MVEQPGEKIHQSPESVHERIKELRKIIYGIAKKSEGADLFRKINSREYDFAMQIQKNHPDYVKYRSYHQLIGSTPSHRSLDGDFEGIDSVETFYKILIEEIKNNDK